MGDPVQILIGRLRDSRLVSSGNVDSELIHELLFLRETIPPHEFEEFVNYIINAHLSLTEALEQLPSHREIRNRYEVIIKSRAERSELGRECPKCHHMTLVPIEVQRARADEPASSFDKCDNCGFQVFLGS